MKTIKLSIFASSLLTLIIAGTPIHNKFDPRLAGQSFGGSLADNIANTDGLGALSLQHHSGSSEINNELKIQKILKKVLSTKKDVSNILFEIANNQAGTVENKNNITELGLIVNQDGDSCNTDSDKNGMTYLNNICQGGQYNDGVSCDDNNSETSNDIYTNGTCVGETSLSSISEFLIAEYNFENNPYDSIGGVNGSENNISYVPGKFGNALNVSGSSDYININSLKPSTANLAEISVSMWAKSPGAQGWNSTQSATLIKNGGAGPRQFNIGFNNSNDYYVSMWTNGGSTYKSITNSPKKIIKEATYFSM